MIIKVFSFLGNTFAIKGAAMEELTFTSVSEEYRSVFHKLMQMYAKELDRHQNRSTDSLILERWTDRIIEKQFDASMCLKLCFYGSSVIGFLYGKIDRTEDKGFKKPGYGYVMEFYVLPEYRRKGYGRRMFNHLEKYFKTNNVDKMYLTADPITGKPFWESMGFVCTYEISPDNNMPVYEKIT